jgi:YD repeat-containing protein
MVFHVLNRGVGRMRLFHRAADFAAFEQILAEILDLSPMRICSYCLMPNHWHLVLWPENDGDLPAFMQRLTVRHVTRWQRVDLAYNADGQYTSLSRYADTTGTNLVATSTYGYNGVGALTSLSYDKGGTNFGGYTWSYDNMGRVTSDSLPDGTDSFTYDAASQITAATHSYQTNESYSYDANGNRTNTGYSTGTNNQVSSDGTYNYTYDNEGNLTQKTAISGGAYTTFTWDYRNRLTDVQNYTSGGTLTKHVHYTYDVYDRLIGKQLDPTGGGTYTTTQRFAYDGDNIILAFNGGGTLTDRLLAGATKRCQEPNIESGWKMANVRGRADLIGRRKVAMSTTF